MSAAPVRNGPARGALQQEGSPLPCSAPARSARLNILRLLAGDAFGVGELGVLGLGQATVGHHLKALTETGLLTAAGMTRTFYRALRRRHSAAPHAPP